MKKKVFLIVYCFFVVSTILYGGVVVVGPLTMRHLFTILMLKVCYDYDGKVYWDQYLKLYVIFFVGLFFSCLISGTIVFFMQQLIAYGLVAYVALWATQICIREGHIDMLMYMFFLVGLLTGIATFFQYFNMSYLAETMRSLLKIPEIRDDFEYAAGKVDDIMVGFSMPGLCSSAIANSVLLLIGQVLSFALLHKDESKVAKFFFVFFFSFFTLSLFLCQQRMALLAGLLISGCLFFQMEGKWIKLLFAGLFLVGGQYVMQNFDLGRFNNILDGTGRDSIYQGCNDFLSDNLLFGGYEKWKRMYGFAPHNLFYNAFIYGGLIGGCSILLMIYRQMTAIFNFLKMNKNFAMLVWGGLYLALTLESLTHNVSIIKGTVEYWFVWSVCLGICRKKIEG